MEISEESINKIVEKIVFELISKSINVNSNYKLLTTKDLAERWQVSERTINDYKAKGIINSIKGLSCIRYNPEDIAKLEGVILETFSPVERRRLESELETLRLRAEKAENALERINSIINEVIYTKLMK